MDLFAIGMLLIAIGIIIGVIAGVVLENIVVAYIGLIVLVIGVSIVTFVVFSFPP